MPKQDEFVMPFHFRRFQSATQDWSDEEVGCYFRLLMHQWGKKSIPSDLTRQKRISESVEKNHWIVDQKFKSSEKGLQNIDMEMIREEREAYSKRQSDRRKKTGTQPEPNHEPTIDQSKKNPPLGLGLVEELNRNVSNGGVGEGETSLACEMRTIWMREKPSYPFDNPTDLQALFDIGMFITDQVKKIKKEKDPHFGNGVSHDEVLIIWEGMTVKILEDRFWQNKALATISKTPQEFWNKINHNGKFIDAKVRSDRRFEELFGKG